MVVLCRSFFTDEVIHSIRSKITTDLWEAYRRFHNTHIEKVSSKNAVYIMNEFMYTCETISTLPTDIYVRQFLSNKFP